MTLRTRFAVWVALLVIVVLAIFGMLTYFGVSQGLRTSLDDSLRLSASQAVSMTDIENGQIDVADDLPDGGILAELRERGLTIRTLSPSGKILQAFGAFRELPVTDRSLSAANNHESIFETLPGTSDDEPVRFYTTPILDQGELVAIVQVAQSLENIRETLGRLLVTLFIGAPLLAAAAALGSYFLVSRALSPIDHITRTAQLISADDLSARLNLPDTHDEVSRLADTFDHMLTRLEDSFRRERQFTSDASHELRTPLAAMQAILSVVGEQRRTPEDYETALADLAEETNRLQNLAENLLLLARDETNLAAKKAQVDLSILLDDLAEAMRPLAESKGLTLDCSAPAGMIMFGNYDNLIRLFVNLLDNAIKFTETGGVTVDGRDERDLLLVEITDTGPGIPPEQIAHIFDRFYRVDTSRSVTGAGLGLAIAYEIARDHGGSIEANSIPGKGTTFRVTFPQYRLGSVSNAARI